MFKILLIEQTCNDMKRCSMKERSAVFTDLKYFPYSVGAIFCPHSIFLQNAKLPEKIKKKFFVIKTLTYIREVYGLGFFV